MLTALVETKHDCPGDDLVSALIGARDGDQRLTQQELLSTIFQLIVAGHDTTASLIENSVVALLRHPDQLAILRAQPDKISAAIEELLRYDAPVPHSTFRYATEPITIAGVTIPAGAQVIINLASANRDDDRYANPETLDIDRTDSRHLAFGHGIHFCLGAPARAHGSAARTPLVAPALPATPPRRPRRTTALGPRRRPRPARPHRAPRHPRTGPRRGRPLAWSSRQSGHTVTRRSRNWPISSGE